MQTFRRRVGWGLAVMGLTGLLWFALTRPPRVRFVFPDGFVATFLGVTSGTNHVQPGRGWARCLRILPGPLLVRLGLGEIADSATPLQLEHPCPVAWFALSGRMHFQPGTEYFLNVKTVDGAGMELPVKRRFFSHPIAAFAIDSFDRRIPNLRLRLYRRANWEGGSSMVQSPEITVPNPYRQDAAPFPAESFPSVKRVEGVEVRLTRVAVEAARWIKRDYSRYHPETIDHAFSWRGYLDVLESGQPTHHWVPYSVEVTDATGNRMREKYDLGDNPMPGGKDAPGRFELVGAWGLPSTESTYKFRCILQRAHGAPMRPGEAWWLRGVPVPAKDALTPLNVATNLNGAEVEVLALVGAEASLPGRSHDVEGQTVLEIRCRAVPVESDLGVAAWTPDGREVAHSWTAEAESYGLAIPEGTRTIDVRLSLVRRLQVEFTVRPEFLLEAAPAK